MTAAPSTVVRISVASHETIARLAKAAGLTHSSLLAQALLVYERSLQQHEQETAPPPPITLYPSP